MQLKLNGVYDSMIQKMDLQLEQQYMTPVPARPYLVPDPPRPFVLHGNPSALLQCQFSEVGGLRESVRLGLQNKEESMMG